VLSTNEVDAREQAPGRRHRNPPRQKTAVAEPDALRARRRSRERAAGHGSQPRLGSSPNDARVPKRHPKVASDPLAVRTIARCETVWERSVAKGRHGQGFPPDQRPDTPVKRSPELSFPFSASGRGGFHSRQGSSLPGRRVGFLTLLTSCSPPALPGLFRPGNALGVLPFEGFPPLVAGHLSARHAPLDVRHPIRRPKRPRLQGFEQPADPFRRRAC
jgi:hypothetical protein